MKKFVELVQRVHNERFSVVMNKIIAEKIPVAFLSLDPIAEVVEIIDKLQRQGFNIVQLITIDRTPTLSNSELDFDIIHLNDVAKIYPRLEYVLVIDEFWDVTNARIACKRMPECKILSINRSNSENIYQIFMQHLTDLQEVYESLIDEKSKKVFRGYWLGNITNQFRELVFSDTPHYILQGFIPKEGAIVIAAGAADGGTATVFSKMGCKVHTFEMQEDLFQDTKKLAEEKNFVVENMAIGAYDGELGYDGHNMMLNGSKTAKVVTVDTYVREKNLPRVDLIQLDVEGSELDVLRGAAGTIARFKPILALSAYHKWDDFWTLMNFVKSIRPDYEFAMRQYPETIADMPTLVKNVEVQYALGLEPDWRDFYECVLFAR